MKNEEIPLYTSFDLGFERIDAFDEMWSYYDEKAWMCYFTWSVLYEV